MRADIAMPPGASLYEPAFLKDCRPLRVRVLECRPSTCGCLSRRAHAGRSQIWHLTWDGPSISPIRPWKARCTRGYGVSPEGPERREGVAERLDASQLHAPLSASGGPHTENFIKCTHLVTVVDNSRNRLSTQSGDDHSSPLGGGFDSLVVDMRAAQRHGSTAVIREFGDDRQWNATHDRVRGTCKTQVMQANILLVLLTSFDEVVVAPLSAP